MIQKRTMLLYLFCTTLFFGPASALGQSSECSAFVAVAVVVMDREQILRNQRVLFRDGRIAEIASAQQVKVPSNCTSIDGHSRYLIPGLVDSHVHLPLVGRIDHLLVLQLLLANGVTTGINTEGSPAILDLRNQIRAWEA